MMRNYRGYRYRVVKRTFPNIIDPENRELDKSYYMIQERNGSSLPYLGWWSDWKNITSMSKDSMHDGGYSVVLEESEDRVVRNYHFHIDDLVREDMVEKATRDEVIPPLTKDERSIKDLIE